MFSSLFCIEIVREGRWCGPGELGRVLVTDLTNRAMPLIRYDVGDVGNFIPGSCSCGRSTPRLRVVGRVTDTVMAHDGSVLSEHAVSDFLLRLPGIAWYQLAQRSDAGFELRVVPSPGASLLTHSVAEQVAAFLGNGARVRVSIVQSIVPESGGKFRFVKSTSYGQLDKLSDP